MESIEERLERIAQAQCWFPFANCDTKAKDPIGSDPMQYCKKHDAAMRQRYAKANPCRCCGKDLGWISPERLAKHAGLFMHATCVPNGNANS